MVDVVIIKAITKSGKRRRSRWTHTKKYLLVRFEAASSREMLTFLRDSLLGMVVVVLT